MKRAITFFVHCTATYSEGPQGKLQARQLQKHLFRPVGMDCILAAGPIDNDNEIKTAGEK